jgi:hypothetical protein
MDRKSEIRNIRNPCLSQSREDNQSNAVASIAAVALGILGAASLAVLYRRIAFGWRSAPPSLTDWCLFSCQH